jgi:hypothetical protein
MSGCEAGDLLQFVLDEISEGFLMKNELFHFDNCSRRKL